MKKNTKAVLLSLLLCPGTGHFVYRRWWRGLLFLVPVAIAITLYAKHSLDMALELMDQVLNGKVDPDQTSMMLALKEQMSAADTLLMSCCLAVLLGCWILALLDIYLLDKDSRS